jgi:diadenosine tetraphosphate (Ap4A) HIT family hydrolase
MNCVFCNIPDEKIICENELAVVIFDRFPVSPGHVLIIPFRHFANFFDATPDEILAIWELIQKSRNIIDERYSPDGYNIGVNTGYSAGQTIMHMHVHMIPRYKGDVQEARGGIRGVIQEKRIY